MVMEPSLVNLGVQPSEKYPALGKFANAALKANNAILRASNDKLRKSLKECQERLDSDPTPAHQKTSRATDDAAALKSLQHWMDYDPTPTYDTYDLLGIDQQTLLSIPMDPKLERNVDVSIYVPVRNAETGKDSKVYSPSRSWSRLLYCGRDMLKEESGERAIFFSAPHPSNYNGTQITLLEFNNADIRFDFEPLTSLKNLESNLRKTNATIDGRLADEARLKFGGLNTLTRQVFCEVPGASTHFARGLNALQENLCVQIQIRGKCVDVSIGRWDVEEFSVSLMSNAVSVERLTSGSGGGASTKA